MKVIQIIEKYLESNKLDIHISSGHKKEKMFGCEICGKSFVCKTQLVQHIGAIHEEKKPYALNGFRIALGRLSI